MKHTKRITQSDIAKKAGVHRTSVSLALKGHASIPKQTRDRIRAIAEQLNYRPDPMLSALASYRSSNQLRSFQGTLAWLSNKGKKWDWRSIGPFRDYYEGAKYRAESSGYTLEIFDLDINQMTAERLAHIFRTRKIDGLLMCPQPKSHTHFNFPWEHFSAVTFGYSLEKPALHRVTASQYIATIQTMRRLYALGYSRIGLAFSTDHDERLENACLSGYLSQVYLHSQQITIPPLIDSKITSQTFLSWFTKHRPDAVIAGPGIGQLIENSGLYAPNDLGVATPVGTPKSTGGETFAGVYERSFHIGCVAVDVLVEMLHRGERGIPMIPRHVLVEGEWKAGLTLCEQQKSPN